MKTKHWQEVFSEEIQRQVENLRKLDVNELPAKGTAIISNFQRMISILDTLEGLFSFPLENKRAYDCWIREAVEQGLLNKNEKESLKEFGISVLKL